MKDAFTRPEQQIEQTGLRAEKPAELEQRITRAGPASGDAPSASQSEHQQLESAVADRAYEPKVEAASKVMDRLESHEEATFQSTDVTKPTDQQVREATEALRDIQELRPEAWQGLDETQRMNAIRQVESRMAEVQRRPPVEVKIEQMKPGMYGGYDRSDRTIHINREHLCSGDSAKVLDTAVHEGRHAYQHYAVEHPGFHPNSAEVKAWDWNLQPGNYRTVEKNGPRAYMEQPVEADAWAYAGRIVPNVMRG